MTLLTSEPSIRTNGNDVVAGPSESMPRSVDLGVESRGAMERSTVASELNERAGVFSDEMTS